MRNLNSFSESHSKVNPAKGLNNGDLSQNLYLVRRQIYEANRRQKPSLKTVVLHLLSMFKSTIPTPEEVEEGEPWLGAEALVFSIP